MTPKHNAALTVLNQREHHHVMRNSADPLVGDAGHTADGQETPQLNNNTHIVDPKSCCRHVLYILTCAAALLSFSIVA